MDAPDAAVFGEVGNSQISSSHLAGINWQEPSITGEQVINRFDNNEHSYYHCDGLVKDMRMVARIAARVTCLPDSVCLI